MPTFISQGELTGRENIFLNGASGLDALPSDVEALRAGSGQEVPPGRKRDPGNERNAPATGFDALIEARNTRLMELRF